MEYSDFKNLSIDELLEIARTDPELKYINLTMNNENYIGCIIEKYCENNPYPTEMIRIHNVLSEFSAIKNFNYFHIMYVFFDRVPKNINQELFLIDFEQFITNPEVIIQVSTNSIMYCIGGISDNILYAKLIGIICVNYPDFSNEKESYRPIFFRFFDDMSEEFAKIIIDICNLHHISYILSTGDFNISRSFNIKSDIEITLAITYLVNAGIKIHECEKISKQLLKFSINKNYLILFDYLLSNGCRAQKEECDHKNNGIHKVMYTNCLTIKEICDLMKIRYKN